MRLLEVHKIGIVSVTDDTTVWRIDADPPSGVGRFVVGETPLGFRQIIPFTTGLPGKTPLGVAVQTTTSEAVSSFELEDLRSDLIYTEGHRLVTLNAYGAQVKEHCSRGR